MPLTLKEATLTKSTEDEKVGEEENLENHEEEEREREL